jgi:hypothetical protein
MTGSTDASKFLRYRPKTNRLLRCSIDPIIPFDGPDWGLPNRIRKKTMDIRKDFPEYERIAQHLRSSSDEWALLLGYRIGGALLALRHAIARGFKAPRSAAATR